MKFNLRSKLLVVIGSMIVAIALLVGIASYAVLSNVLLQRTNAQLQSISDIKAGTVNLFISDSEKEIAFSASDENAKQSLVRYLMTRNAGDKPAALGAITEIVKGTASFESAFLADAGGTVVVSTNPEDEGKIRSDDPFILQAAKLPFIQNFQYDTTTGKPEMLIVAPVFDTKSTLSGFIAGRVNAAQINSMMTERSGLGNSGETFLINSTNTVITDLRKEQNEAFKKTIFLPQDNECLAGTSNFRVTNDYHGDSVVGYWHWIPEIQSCLVTKIDTKEAFQSIIPIIGLLSLIIVGVGIMAGLLGYIVARNVISNPINNLYEVAVKVKEGDLKARVQVHSLDEIGQLGVVFNDMTAKLQESYADLENKVAERTLDLEKAKRELEQKVSLVEEQSVKSEESKLAMTNLLEDARTLEEDLKKERDTATTIINTMEEGLFSVDTQYNIILVNKKAEAFFGISQTDSIGINLADVTTMYVGESPVASEDRPLMKTLKTGVPMTIGLDDDYYLRDAGGRHVPVSLETSPLKHGDEIIGALVTFHDITHDKEIKHTIENQVIERTHELNDEKLRLSASIASLPVGFVMVNPDHEVIFINQNALTILGLENKSVRTMDDILHVFPGDSFIHKLHEDYHKENAKVAKTGELNFLAKILKVSFIPISARSNESDENLGSIVLLDDITEARILERSRDEFFSIASHELRTPLTAIRGNTSLIQEHYLDNQEQDMKEMIGDIHESSVRLINIVNDFLNMSRLEQERFEFKPQIFNLQELIVKALHEYQVTGSRRKLSLEYRQPQAPLPVVLADPDRVREIIINLVGNSLKFTEEGGITIETMPVDHMVQVNVSDNGRGIPIQNQALLFHKFQQAGDSLFTRDTTKGTGLGLYISRLMIEKMGGKIWLVKSEEGKGTTFAFTVPVAHT